MNPFLSDRLLFLCNIDFLLSGRSFFNFSRPSCTERPVGNLSLSSFFISSTHLCSFYSIIEIRCFEACYLHISFSTSKTLEIKISFPLMSHGLALRYFNHSEIKHLDQQFINDDRIKFIKLTKLILNL